MKSSPPELFDQLRFWHHKQQHRQCPVQGCGKTFFLSPLLELFDHLHFRHHKQRRVLCPIQGCGKTFLRATLTKHSRTHTDTRRYVCGTCGKRFLDKQTLDEHGVTHLQIKPFQCHICLKQLTRRSRLRMHLRAHEEALCPALVPVCAACRRAFADVPRAQEHVTKSAACIETFAREMREEAEEPTAVLSPTSGLVRPATRKPDSSCALIACEAVCAGAAAMLAPLPPALRRAVRIVQVEKAFRCEYCEDVFYLEEALNNHRSIHKGVKNPFTCHICKVSFATYSRCTTHKTTHGFYKRSLADAKKQDKPLKEEAGPSANGILGYGGFPVVKHFLCEDCGRSYLHWTYLQVHRRMKHANENYIYKCNHCDLTFPNSWSVAYHRKKVHGKTGLDEGNGATKMAKDDYRIPCRDCEEVLPNKTALYKHRKKEHSDLSLRINSVHVCHVCSKRYLSRAGLEAHTRTHAARAACAHCGDSFAHAQKLHQHLKEVHGHELDFHCNVCDKRFASRGALSAHMLSHAAARAHSCAVCGHACRTPAMLAEHARTHTGERPFPCDVCGVAFRRSTAMRNHRLIHTGVRAWPCARCPKRFRVRSDLNTHRRRKHPAGLAVIELEGLNPGHEQIMECLAANNIPNENVVEITKMSFPKGTSSVVPDSARALALVSAPRAPVAWGRPPPLNNDLVQRRRGAPRSRRGGGRGIARQPRRPAILQRGAYPANTQHEELTEINVQMLLRDSTLDRQGALPLEDSLLLE
ncbi:hypothetical protein MSG28_015156 [Choristoneura fumiferana]|uniref:Uncharacterized protein n=1 Tax=Choristoneura fumiferana TaxID=7141 RepID=A0ACC0KYG0_CHOFU|nr:hypothetical protein MSG28_015156 [Choristoneura fumiferana]